MKSAALARGTSSSVRRSGIYRANATTRGRSSRFVRKWRIVACRPSRLQQFSDARETLGRIDDRRATEGPATETGRKVPLLFRETCYHRVCQFEKTFPRVDTGEIERPVSFVGEFELVNIVSNKFAPDGGTSSEFTSRWPRTYLPVFIVDVSCFARDLADC